MECMLLGQSTDFKFFKLSVHFLISHAINHIFIKFQNISTKWLCPNHLQAVETVAK